MRERHIKAQIVYTQRIQTESIILDFLYIYLYFMHVTHLKYLDSICFSYEVSCGYNSLSAFRPFF